MRAVLQRVKGATVHVDGRLVSSIGPGIVALVGVEVADDRDEIPSLAKKVLGTKLWPESLRAEHVVVPPQYRVHAAQGADGASANGAENVGGAPSSSSSSSSQPPPQTPAQPNEAGPGAPRPWRTNVVEFGGEILCVSQFTLHARLSRGTKPDFHRSKPGAEARELYDAFLAHLGQAYDAAKIKDGAFGEMMDVSLTNDGPVTILVDTLEGGSKKSGGTSTPAPA